MRKSSTGLTRAAEEDWVCANAYMAHGAKLQERLQEALSSKGKRPALDASAPGLITQCSCSSGSDILFQETEAPVHAEEEELARGAAHVSTALI